MNNSEDNVCGNPYVIPEKEIDIQGYVIINKFSGERWGSCYDSKTGAKTSWYGAFCRRTGYPPQNLAHFKGVRFDEQDTFILVPLVLHQ